jgi:hypothetical protein
MLLCRAWRDCVSRVAFHTLRFDPETINYTAELIETRLPGDNSLRYVRSLVCYHKSSYYPLNAVCVTSCMCYSVRKHRLSYL